MLERFKPLTAEAIPHGGTDIIPDEIFLLIPALRAKAAQGGIIEVVLVSLVDKVAAFLDSWQQPANPATKPGAGSGIDAKNLKPELSREEVSALILKLRKAIPELNDVETLVDNLGLPPKVLSFAQTYLAANGSDPELVVKWILDNVDKKGWMGLSTALNDACKARRPPHLNLILQDGTPWNRATLAVLGCPQVQLSRTQVYIAGHVGLGGIVSLWKSAQKFRRSDDARDPGHLSASAANAIKVPLEDICPLQEYNGFDDLHGVLVVERATYVADAMTGLVASKTQDVTAEVAALLDPVTGFLPLSQVTLPATWRMGKHRLKVLYRAVPKSQDTKVLVKRSTALSKALADAGLIDGAAKLQSGPLTWYKLPEWMQVEIVQIFGDSMNHTPWYRFPFMDILKTYFGVLAKEASVVADRHGWSAALGSTAFFTDLIPGIVMGILFGQMSLLAYPLKQGIGEAYDEETLIEQVIATAPRGTDWKDVDSRITEISEVVGGVWVFTVPTFKPFTEVLIRIASQLPSATLLQISNQKVIQVRVEIPARDPKNPQQGLPEILRGFNKLPGCHVNFDFQYPHVGGDERPRTQVSLAVQVPFLLSVIRHCIDQDILVVQVYDFWG